MAKVYDLEIPDLPEGYTPLEAIVVVKCLDEKGNLDMHQDATEGLNTWEAIGMVRWCGRSLEIGLHEDDE